MYHPDSIESVVCAPLFITTLAACKSDALLRTVVPTQSGAFSGFVELNDVNIHMDQTQQDKASSVHSGVK